MSITADNPQRRNAGIKLIITPNKLVKMNNQPPRRCVRSHTTSLLLESQRQREYFPQGVRFARSPGGKWLGQALDKARAGNRNDVGFWLACQLRDDKIPEAEARSIILTYSNLAPTGREQYTSKEAIASVTQAYNRPPRQPARRI